MTTENNLNKLYIIALGDQRRRAGSICGQGFTDYVCLKCDKTFINPNTNCPNFCVNCSDEIKTMAIRALEQE